MATPMTHPVTIGDVLKGLESMEAWIRQLRGALATIDQGQRLDVKPRLVVASAPRVSGGLCPPPPPPAKRPRPKKKATKKTTKK